MNTCANQYGLKMEHGLLQIDSASHKKLRKSKVRINDQWASHPDTVEREKKLNELNLPSDVVTDSAWTLFTDPEKLQREMIRLYKEEGFNPLGGCLPMLIPWPVLITLFFVFQNTIEFRGVEFLWLPDLSRPDPIYLLPLLLGFSLFITQWMNLRAAPQDNPQMKMMMWFMPIIMVVIFLNFASGLNLYYAASNLAGIPQQIQIIRERGKARARLDAKKEEG